MCFASRSSDPSNRLQVAIPPICPEKLIQRVAYSKKMGGSGKFHVFVCNYMAFLSFSRAGHASEIASFPIVFALMRKIELRFSRDIDISIHPCLKYPHPTVRTPTNCWGRLVGLFEAKIYGCPDHPWICEYVDTSLGRPPSRLIEVGQGEAAPAKREATSCT